MVNGVARAATDACTIAELLADLGVETRGVAVAVNGEIARRSAWTDTMVEPTDTVEIVTAVAGG
jgi:sulfur carrier protein